MSQQIFGQAYGGTAPENYQRYFVPAIGAPMARDLVKAAALRPGERVLDVACGTGVVTRLAADSVGGTGTVVGVDVNEAMLAVARAATSASRPIEWHQTSAEAMPLRDASFDAVLCQMGLQFVPDKSAALREMRRVTAPNGRMVLNVPGPTPALMSIMADALSRYIHPEAGAFVQAVFSLHDAATVEQLVGDAGFHDPAAESVPKTLHLPAPTDFLWQYLHSTPLAGMLTQSDDAGRAALERDVCAQWEDFVEDGHLRLEVGVTTAKGWV